MTSAWPFDPLPPFAHDVVVLDPPWHFDLRSAKGEAKSPQAQYATMSLAEVKRLPVGDLVAPGGIVILWTTWPLVAIGAHVDVIAAWGLKPVSGGGWAKRTINDKLRWGPGYVARSVHEPYIIASLPDADWRGAAFPNLVETFEALSLDGLAREHSRKPDEFYGLVERAWPDARRADLFARQSRPGWATWGNQASLFDGPAA
jgi:N6-adenosine-specific RNA methylase IME4